MPHLQSLLSAGHAELNGQIGSFYAATLTGAITLDVTYPNVCKFNPGVDPRNVTLDAAAKANGVTRRIINAAAGAVNLVVLDAAAATIVTINQNEQAEVYSNGTTWVLICITAIALA